MNVNLQLGVTKICNNNYNNNSNNNNNLQYLKLFLLSGEFLQLYSTRKRQ